jgi:hypothetical protein
LNFSFTLSRRFTVSRSSFVNVSRYTGLEKSAMICFTGSATGYPTVKRCTPIIFLMVCGSLSVSMPSHDHLA